MTVRAGAEAERAAAARRAGSEHAGPESAEAHGKSRGFLQVDGSRQSVRRFVSAGSEAIDDENWHEASQPTKPGVGRVIQPEERAERMLRSGKRRPVKEVWEEPDRPRWEASAKGQR